MRVVQSRAARGALVVACTLLAVGCGRDAGPPGAAAGAATPLATARTTDAPRPTPDIGALDIDQLRVRAGIATQEGRVHAPAGDNAIEYYLALRARAGDPGPTGLALQELQPYVVIGAEQALAAGNWAEVDRLVTLLERIEPLAPSIPRLAAELAAGRAREDAARAQREALAQAPASPSPAAPPAPARAPEPAPAVPAVAAAPPPVAAATASAQRAVPERQTEPSRSAPAAARVPRLLAEVPARYPPVARSRRLEGNVVVEFTVRADGSVADISVVASDPPGVFDRAAVAAVSAYRFDAGSAPATIRRTLEFRLQPGRAGG